MKPSTNNKAIIFDSGPLISFTMNGATDLIRALKGIFPGKFLITQEVKHEIIERPLEIKRFELEALRLQQLLDDKVLEMPSSVSVKDSNVTQGTSAIMDAANNVFRSSHGPVRIVDLGETSCMALSRILAKKNFENILAIDERTTRMLIEDPSDLQNFLDEKLKANLTSSSDVLQSFKDFKVIRSPELAYVAWKKGLIKMKGPRVLDAFLYGMKFKGAAISIDEINEIERMK